MTSISEKQQKIIAFIDRFLADHNYPPSIRDIQRGCGISSTSVVDYNLKVLENGGCIRRRRDVSRGIEVLEGPFSLRSRVPVPVLGSIAAGEPIPVPEADTWDAVAAAETIEVPLNLTAGRQGVYALRVRGLSMIDALINDGDIILMQQTGVVENGETAAVWLRDEKEVTLKKVYVEEERIRLQPANRQMRPIFTATDNVEVQGRVIGVIRQLA